MAGRRSNIAEVGESGSYERDADGYGTSESLVTVGAELRAARERLGWTLPAISAMLRIRLPYLEAIEAGQLSVLPGNAYAVGFVRTYAQTLGLDPDEIARRFKAEAADINRKTELTFPAPVPDRGIPAGAIVLVGAVIAIIAYIGWYRFSAIESGSPDVVQPVPARLAPLASTTPVPPPAPVAEPPQTAASDQALAAPPSAAHSPPPAPPPAATTPPKEAMGPPVPPATAKDLAASASAPQMTSNANPGGPPAPPTLPPTVTAAPNAPTASDSPRLQVKAVAESWVQVRDKQGGVLLNRVLRGGETWPVPTNRGPLLMTTGNAGGTELVVDGTAQAPLGSDGAVKRDIPLDIAALGDIKAPGGGAASGPASAPARTSRTN